MEELKDLSWIRQMHLGNVADRFDFSIAGRSYDVVLMSSDRKTSSQERFMYRLLVFESGKTRPFYAVGLEATILGSYCISEQHGSEDAIIQHFSTAPSLGEFKELAIEQAVARVPELEDVEK